MPDVLAIELRRDPRDAHELALVATYRNLGGAPLALAFWWNRSMRIVDAAGRTVAPAAGPVLPCGVAESWHVLAPGETHERAEPLACTQPAGRSERIGWSYALAAGDYRITLVFEAPAAHGFSQSEPHPSAFRGRVESHPLAVTIAARRSLWSRLVR